MVLGVEDALIKQLSGIKYILNKYDFMQGFLSEKANYKLSSEDEAFLSNCNEMLKEEAIETKTLTIDEHIDINGEALISFADSKFHHAIIDLAEFINNKRNDLNSSFPVEHVRILQNLNQTLLQFDQKLAERVRTLPTIIESPLGERMAEAKEKTAEEVRGEAQAKQPQEIYHNRPSLKAGILTVARLFPKEQTASLQKELNEYELSLLKEVNEKLCQTCAQLELGGAEIKGLLALDSGKSFFTKKSYSQSDTKNKIGKILEKSEIIKDVFSSPDKEQFNLFFGSLASINELLDENEKQKSSAQEAQSPLTSKAGKFTEKEQERRTAEPGKGTSL